MSAAALGLSGSAGVELEHRSEHQVECEHFAQLIRKVSPHIAGPHGVGVMRSAAEFAADRIEVHKAYLLSCTNARYDDLVEAAAVLRGRHVADTVEELDNDAMVHMHLNSQGYNDGIILGGPGAVSTAPTTAPCSWAALASRSTSTTLRVGLVGLSR